MERKQRSGGFLGIRFHEVPRGLFVDSLHASTPASRIGLEPGDIITRILGIDAPLDGDLFLRTIFMSDSIRMEFLRGEKRLSLSTSLADLDRILSVDDSAPDFELSSPEGDFAVRLSDLWKRKPVLLVFGSHT